jgi:aldehyde:ferredoxin oxidoreductase
MKNGGYAGKGLHIDLTTKTLEKIPLDTELAQRFIGGFGLNNKLAFDLIPQGIDPLSPQNVIIIGSGVLGGTAAPGSSKVMATTKLPINNAIGTAFGGSFSYMLKYAGYDYLVITGKAAEPVYLKIIDDDIELCAAGPLWGKDIHQTTDELRAKYGPASNVIAIGPAGENLVKFAFTLINKYATLGRGGLGAVFGAKNLKAIVVKGTQGVEVADQKNFMKLVDSLVDTMMKIPFRNDWIKLGIYLGWPTWTKVGFIGKNWTELYPEEKANKLYGPQEYQKVFKATIACPSCPLGDKAVLELKEGEFAGLVSPVSHGLGCVLSWGIRGDVGSMSRAVKCHDLCNRYGIDDLTATALMDFAVDLYQEGIISKKDTDGLELKRDFDTSLALIEKINSREGIGDILAEGFREAVQRFGQEAAKYAIEVKGLDIIMDPRGHLEGMGAISQCVNPRGTYGIAGNSPAFRPGTAPDKIAKYCQKLGASEETVRRICSPPGEFNLGRLTKYAEDWYSVCCCLGICARQSVIQCYDIETAAQLYTYATGIEINAPELMQAGERSWNILKLANVREGFTRKDDRLPDKFLEPLKTQKGEVYLMDYQRTKVLAREDLEKLLDDYYEERGWEIERGIPTKKKLEELGLSKEAATVLS